MGSFGRIIASGIELYHRFHGHWLKNCNDIDSVVGGGGSTLNIRFQQMFWNIQINCSCVISTAVTHNPEKAGPGTNFTL